MDAIALISLRFSRDTHLQRLNPLFVIGVVVEVRPAGGTAVFAGDAGAQIDGLRRVKLLIRFLLQLFDLGMVQNPPFSGSTRGR